MGQFRRAPRPRRLGAMTPPAAGRSFTTIDYDVADAVATLTLDRPDRLNALDSTMERELLEVWDLVDADDAVRAVIVTGRGRAFCAGFDLAEGDGFDVHERARRRGTEELRARRHPARQRRTDLAADLPLHEARDRGDQRRRGRVRRDLPAADGRPSRLRDGALRLRLQPARDVHGRRLELVPAADRRA